MLAILVFILILGLLVFVHEAGHCIAAKRAGMGVEEFGFGFPPRLIGVQRVSGKWRMVRGGGSSRKPSTINHQPPTIYSLNWIPLGGFVRITGESGGDADDPRSFAAKPRWQRAIVLVAGVAMNLVLAIVLFTAVYSLGAPQVIDDLPPGATIRDRRTSIIGVLRDGPAAGAGVQSGDAITAIDGESFTDIRGVQQYIGAHADQDLRITVDRNGQSREFTLRPAPLPGVERPGIGVQLVEVGTVRFPLHLAAWQGVRATGFVIAEILRALGGLVRGLVVERAVTVDVVGPVGIAVMTGQVVSLGFVHLLQFTAVLSANLALLNVFPFPALDGGRLFILLIEAIRRRSIGKRIENAIHAAGFALLLLLVVAVTYHDIAQFGGSIMSSLRSTVGF